MRQEYLPEEFQKKMRELLGEEFEDYLASFDESRRCGLRVNTSKMSPLLFESLSPFPVKRVPWIQNGFFYGEEAKPAKDPYYSAGLYYLQEPSAMTPAALLPVEPGDMVLDLCAAPGGKSTELGAKLLGQGMLFANDISNSRAKALLKNLELFGIPNICVTSETPEHLSGQFQSFFDKILIDAPCSGEGMFRKDETMVKSWLENGPEYYAKIQRRIVLEAEKMLKPGGLMMYSTCTFDTGEDEDVIRFLLESCPSMELVEIKKQPGFSGGIGMPQCVRLFPHRIQGEGHFLALLKKRDVAGEAVKADGKRQKASEKNDGLLLCKMLFKNKSFTDFLSLISREFEPDRFYIKNNCIYYLPEGFREIKGLRFLRTGLFMGELKKDRFEPAQALAMSLKMEEFKSCLDLSKDDERVIRYLKGETLSLKQEEAGQGWCLVCVDGYPLGFAKKGGITLKNKYYPGWRWL